MALLFCDSWDHYVGNEMGRKWTGSSHGFGTNINTDATTGRFGTYGLWLNGYGDRWIYKDLGVNAATLIVGMGFQLDNLLNGQAILSLKDGSSQQVELRVNSSGQLYVTRANVTILAPGAGAVRTGQYNYVEIKVTFNDTTGAVDVRLNNTTILSGTSLDTKNTANAYANRVQISEQIGHGFAGNLYADDLYVCDGTGGVNNNFLGDVRVQCIKPNGNGNSSQFVGSDGNSVDNYLLVDDPNDMDDDTTYVESATIGNKDTYAHGNLTPAAGTVAGVQISFSARKTDAGTRELVSVARLAGTETDSAARALGTSYAGFQDIRETKPGGGAWSISDVNSAEFGIKVAA